MKIDSVAYMHGYNSGYTREPRDHTNDRDFEKSLKKVPFYEFENIRNATNQWYAGYDKGLSDFNYEQSPNGIRLMDRLKDFFNRN